MKKLPEIPPAVVSSDGPELPESQKTELIGRLEREGYRPISVDRAIITIEQVEPGDKCPKGWAADPLCITIHPDPDAGFATNPDVLWLHAGRSGLMDVYFRRGKGPTSRSIMKMVPVANIQVHDLLLGDDRARAMAIAQLLDGCVGPGFTVWSELRGEYRTDDELGRLAADVKAAVHRYLGRLKELSTDPGKS